MRDALIIKLVGGLGNQMFQYAAGRAMSLRQGRRLLIDGTAYLYDRHHQGFEIKSVFHCPVGVASPQRVAQVLGFARFEPVQRLLVKLPTWMASSKGLLLEPHFHYWREFSSIRYGDYMRGYWQSERYFESVKDVLLQDFVFRAPLDARNEDIRALISSTNSVSVHIRRGDYVYNPQASATHGLCSIDYYQRAIGIIKGAVHGPKFFFFSDDMEWVKSHFDLGGGCCFVDWNMGADSYKDMQLMSVCKHNIIANSSFSWWGAWLNRNSRKIVVAPKRWFAAGINDRDLVPSTWTRI